MPTRPIQHQLETESRLAFESLVGPLWVYRPKVLDYGIDGEIEIFEESGKASGLYFLVQLKSAEKISKQPSISLEIEWIKYYHSLELPVLLVLWVKQTAKTYWRWAEDVDLYYAKAGARSLKVHFSDEWKGDTSKQLRRHVEFRGNIKAGKFRRPLTIGISAPGANEIAFHLRALCARVPRILSYSDDPDIRCSLSKDGLKVAFSGHYGAVLHSKKRVEAPQVARRAIIAVVISLDYFGALNEAAELWAALPDLADEIISVDVAWRVLSILARAGAYEGLREVIQRLHGRFKRVELIAPLHPLRYTAPRHRRRELTQLLIELIEADLQDAVGEDRSIASYNLGKLWEDLDWGKARKHFERAIRSSAFYANRAYFWSEIGASLFNHHRFAAAVRCYRHAYETLGETERRSRYGDALMHAGKYSEALQVFEAIVGKPLAPDHKPEAHLDRADAHIKRFAIAHIRELFGMTSQQRQRQAADRCIGPDTEIAADEMIARCDRAIRFDAISNRVWFCRAVALYGQGNHKEALSSFLVAAATGTTDDEAWLNVLILALELKERDLLATVLTYLVYERGVPFLKYIGEEAQRRSYAHERAMLMEIATIFVEKIPKQNQEALLRIHGPTGTEVLKGPVR
jgi:tetratricopeptide (TPR) repeat protein